MVVIGLGVFALRCVLLFIKGPQFQGNMHKLIASIAIVFVMFIGLPVTTSAAQGANVVASYFSNIAQGYENYGFIYGFSSSVLDRSMHKPKDYSTDTVAAIMADVDNVKKNTSVNADNAPNIICVLLESFCDPDEIKFLDCESIAADLSDIGYGTHAVHNNGGNFYSRANAFSMMGFDSFTSKELMNIQTYTPNGSWATDDILVSETIKTLDSTPDQPDFTYTITVGAHGDYPATPVIADPQYSISGVENESRKNQWTYYVNQLHETDRFMADLIRAVNARDEDTIIVFFGDHLPTMGLTADDMRSGDIYKTNYVTWNNFDLEKIDADLYACQLMAAITDQADIHEGTIFKYYFPKLERICLY